MGGDPAGWHWCLLGVSSEPGAWGGWLKGGGSQGEGASFQADWCWEPPQGGLSPGCEARAWPFSGRSTHHRPSPVWEGIPESPPSQCLGLLVQPEAVGGTGEAQERMLGKPEGWREGAGPTPTSVALGEFLNQAGSMIWSVKWELCGRCYPWHSGMPSTWGWLPLIKPTI